MIRRLILAGCLIGPAIARAEGESSTTRVDFEHEVRPILSKSCFGCHGPEKRKAGLRLDRKADALAGGDSGPPFEPGQAAESLLIEYVSGADPDKIMPPDGDRLTSAEVDRLRRWIDQGADWPERADDPSASAASPGSDHWAFQAPVKPATPEVRDRAWVRDPIDAFILARLEAEGIAPSPEADRVTLIRRLNLDLLGLPPTPAEVDAFVGDRGPDAYERLVDRLFASPRFGERWGRHWLDLARYADSDGYEKDSPRPHAWRWRDWVIDAFNRDLPFDQFTVEQLAGDLLPGGSLEQKAATGFHRNTLTNREGGVDPEEFRVAAVVDRVNTTGTVWLGLTVACAQCHTHKYDPILHREYYGLFAFFNSSVEEDLYAPSPAEARAFADAKAAFDRDHAPLVEAAAAYERDERPDRQRAWEEKQRPRSERWAVLTPDRVRSTGDVSLDVRPDGSVLASGLLPDTDTYVMDASTGLRGITAFRLEVLADPKLPTQGPGRVKGGKFRLTDFRVEVRSPTAGGDPTVRSVALRSATADSSEEGHPVAGAIDDDPKDGWSGDPEPGRSRLAVFETVEDLDVPEGSTLTVTIDQQAGDRLTIGRFRVSAIAAPRPIRADDLPDAVSGLLAIAPDGRTPDQSAELGRYHRSIDEEAVRLDRVVARHAAKAPTRPDSKVPVLLENPGPPTTNVHIRGDFLRKGEEVKPDTLAVLPPLEFAGGQPTRLDLARWLVDGSNPLTSRVAVNRTWAHLFGRGLVATPDDFGTRGELPSHPELLDWLAREFVDQGWGRKTLIRAILTSNTYRQSSRHRPDLDDRDPNNVLLARQARFRPEAEVVRDLALVASGLLVDRVGGPSVRPPQSAGIADLTYAGAAKWVDSRGPDRYRRGLYTWFQRTSPYPMLLTFDAPDANVCAVKRERSNTPLQALTLLNDVAFVECARALGLRVAGESSSDDPETRARFAFRLALAREPSAEELQILVGLLDDLRSTAEADPESASKLAGPDLPDGVEAPEAAAWVALSRAILNLDEFVNRD